MSGAPVLHSYAKPAPADFGPYLASLKKIVSGLAPGTPFRGALNLVLSSLAGTMHFLRPHIVVQDPENGSLHLSMALGQAAVPHLSYAPGTGITGQVFASGKPIIVGRMKDHPDFMNRLFERSEDQLATLSFICVPVLAERASSQDGAPKVLGTLSADTGMAPPDVLRLRCSFLEVVAALMAHQVACLQEDLLRQSAHYTRQDDKPLPSALSALPAIVVSSQAMNHVLHHVAQVAPSQTTVLLRGESGSGKELMAAAIHQCSERAKGPFVKLNCAALPADLVEGELFGWQRGAFTGAQQGRRGVFEQASSGTLFLDEIGDLSLPAQAKVLRAIQEREIVRLGSEHPVAVDVRLICATHQPLEELVKQGLFREDLYYRINVFPLFLPPLRERRDDILPLAEHFLHRFARSYGRPARRMSPQAADLLTAYAWPGNVRELQNAMECAVLLCEEEAVHACHLPPALRHQEKHAGERAVPADSPLSFRQEISSLEKKRLEEALRAADGNIHQAARDIDITYRIFYYKMKKYGIDYRAFLKKRR
ncbi:sigma 54-interacting transcriptional regulator [uncultured Mailhella sp.]|uniref:sigma-54-dependent Fis family transcriptional regulator n=1 Tax=uncultured Mailhella sp. TaxID=1981031 RepID=UPI002603B271|nr:sigma 54-interacting transcriptional regulator [uncultured Mailhella sp.]